MLYRCFPFFFCNVLQCGAEVGGVNWCGTQGKVDGVDGRPV